MDIAGKTVAFLGDSITEGVGASCVENRFTDVFARLTGGVALNYGVSATRIARQKVVTEDLCDRDFNMRVEEIDASADVVVVFGGTNDFGHGDAPIGKFTDNTVYTFYGALHVLYRQLLERFPEKDIIVLTPLHRLSENVTINERGIPCEPLKKYVEAIREVVASPHVELAVHLFADLALATSFLGVSLGLFDYLADMFQRKNSVGGRLQSGIITFLPPLAFALFYPRGFVMALGYAGVALAVLALIMPALLVMKSRREHPQATWRVAGGAPTLWLVLLCGIGIVAIQFSIAAGLLPAVG